MGYAYQTQWDSPNFTKGRAGLTEIFIHWWGDPDTNPSYEGVVSVLCNPARQASAHYIATGTGRRVACLVSPSDTAWHAGTVTNNRNPYSIGIEADPRCRPEDYDVLAELVADIRSAYGNLPLRRHSEVVATQCPGNYDLNRINALAANKISHDAWGAVTDKVAPPPVVVPPVTARDRVNAIYLEILARPVDESAVAGRMKQTEAVIRSELLSSKEYADLKAKMAAQKLAEDAARAKAEQDAIKAEEARVAALKVEADRIAKEKAEQAALSDNGTFITWLKAIFEIIARFLTSWKK